MSLKDKYQDYKQRKEARAFFNRHNDQKASIVDMIIAGLIGFLSAAFLSILLNTVTTMLGFSLSILTIVIGIIQGQLIIKILNKGGMSLAIVAAASFFLGVAVGNVLYLIFTMPIFSLSSFMSLFHFWFSYVFKNNILSLLIDLCGAIASYFTVINY